MNSLITAALAFLTFLSFSAAINAIENDRCNFHGRAFFYESGADRMMWSVEINKEGGAVVKYNENMLDLSKKETQEKLTLGQEDNQKICNIFWETEYLKLHEHINKSPAPLHAPWFVIEFSINKESHKVELYNPEGAKGQPGTKNFLELWKRLGNMMPIKPPNPEKYMQ